MAFIDQLINQTAVPGLEQLMQFTWARQQVLTHNIANIDTPGYRVQDLSVSDFQNALSDAIRNKGANGGQLVLRGQQVRTGDHGGLVFSPDAAKGYNVLSRDQANRHVEKQMSAMAENSLTFNVASELLRKQFEGLKQAIRQRS